MEGTVEVTSDRLLLMRPEAASTPQRFCHHAFDQTAFFVGMR